MSTAGIKRSLSEEEDSPEYLLPEQPGKDSDEDINSPECLLSMQPVRDCYSSDDDWNKADKMENTASGEQGPQPKIPKTKGAVVHHSYKTMTVYSIVKACGIRFMPELQSKYKFEEIKSFGISEILDFVVPSIIPEPKLTGKLVIDAVLNMKSFNPELRMLYESKSYSFPATYEGSTPEFVHSPRLYEGFRVKFISLKVKMNDVQSSIATVTPIPKNMSIQHDKLKDFFNDFFTADETILRRACVQELVLPRKVCDKNNRRKIHIVHDEVTSSPDIVIGSTFQHAVVPVEVYSPHKLEEEEESSVMLMGEYVSDSSSGLTSDDCEDAVSLDTFIKTVMPRFLCPKQYESPFKEKLTKQLLLQLLCTSQSYVQKLVHNNFYTRPCGKVKEKRVFIGLLVFQFYVYILKLEGYETDIDTFTTVRKNEDKMKAATDRLNVQFFPVPLDVRIPSHGIALLFLVKYFRCVYKC